jgi:hypothetical protein
MQTQDKNEIELLNCWREITEHEKEIVLNFIGFSCIIKKARTFKETC